MITKKQRAMVLATLSLQRINASFGYILDYNIPVISNETGLKDETIREIRNIVQIQETKDNI